MAFSDNFSVDGLGIKPDGPFYADLLFDYLNTTPYKWSSNQSRTQFFIEAFEYSPDELEEKLTVELEENNILVVMEKHEL